MKYKIAALIAFTLVGLSICSLVSKENELKDEIQLYMQEIVGLAKAGEWKKLEDKVNYARVANRKRHSYSPAELNALLSTLNLKGSAITISHIESGKCIYRVQGDISLDFELEIRGDKCVLIGVST